MSNFTASTFNPRTGGIEQAHWMDDHFSHHHYGVMFEDGTIVDPFKEDCERVGPKAHALIKELEEYACPYTTVKCHKL